MSSSSTNRMSLTGARYMEPSMRERGHDVGGGELDEAAHAVIVLQARREHGVQWRGRGCLPIGEHLAQLGGGHPLPAQEFRQQANAETRDRCAVQHGGVVNGELRTD